MVNAAQFESAAKLAIMNIVHHGDTDIFPFSFERFSFEDQPTEVLQCIIEHNKNFDEYLARYSPFNATALSPVNYFGFRWATQLDFIWNAHLLACVLAIGPKIEAARLPVESNSVFSYRLNPDKTTGSLFNKSINFRAFLKESLNLAEQYKYVVLCDISEFYPRLGHHRLENALKQVDSSSEYPRKIMELLKNFSRTNSFGLPVGGPAARILSELTINQIDRLLIAKGIKFTRFADDFHIFANTREDAYRSLIFLSEKLSINQGLTLQKSKTRIMSSLEFRATMPALEPEAAAGPPQENSQSRLASEQRPSLMAFSLRFDPYSPTASDDYEKLKQEVKKYDILEILKDELGKSRVHTTLARKLVQAVRYLDDDIRDQAVLSVLENSEVLYPIYSAVLIMLDQTVDSLSEEVRRKVKTELSALITSDSHIFRVEMHVAYAIRVLSHFNEPEVTALLQKIYDDHNSPVIRRDIILTMARYGEWYWLSDIRNNFRQLSIPERRAFIVASYALKDEGQHWRDHAKKEFSPFENVILKWAGKKMNVAGWKVSL